MSNPRPSIEYVGSYRGRQERLGRSRKEYYVTEVEHAKLKAYLKKIRACNTK